MTSTSSSHRELYPQYQLYHELLTSNLDNISSKFRSRKQKILDAGKKQASERMIDWSRPLLTIAINGNYSPARAGNIADDHESDSDD